MNWFQEEKYFSFVCIQEKQKLAISKYIHKNDDDSDDEKMYKTL
jgi:hypothetical protein